MGVVFFEAPDEKLKLAILAGLEEGGYVEGRNLVVEYFSAFGNPDCYRRSSRTLSAEK